MDLTFWQYDQEPTNPGKGIKSLMSGNDVSIMKPCLTPGSSFDESFVESIIVFEVVFA